MVEKKSRRKLFRVAKELNLAHQTITEFLEKKGHRVSGLNTPISDDIYEEIIKRFSQEKVKAEKIAKRREERAKEEIAVELTEEMDLTVPEKEETSLEEEVVEEVIPEAGEEEPTIQEEPELPKIDEIQQEISPEPQEIIEPEIEKKPEIVAEEESLEEVELLEPKIGDIVDHPGAKRYLEFEQEQKKRKSEKKRHQLQKIKEKAEEKEKPGKEPKEKEIVPRRIKAAEKEEILTEEPARAEPLETVSESPKKKKEKKKEEVDDILSEKERRRRKAFEMIRKESRRGKMKMPIIDESLEERELELDDRKKRLRKKKEIDHQEVDDTVKKTLASIHDTGSTVKKKRKKIKDTEEEIHEATKEITVTEFITVQELANLIGVNVTEIIKKCLDLGQMVSMNQRLEMDMIKLIAEDYGFNIKEQEFASSYIEELFGEEEEEKETNLIPRHPVVTVMGHVDHGKTSLLDYIRHSNVVAGESGGITQHIGAYVVNVDDGRKITFLDTPGHEAFTAMRSRGAQITDIVVLVIAADDKVMPQTEEAIDHALAANVAIVIAINKIDKDGANPQAIRKQLADRNILVEDWGGKYQVVEVSAKTGAGIQDLLEKILLEAELLELKANVSKKASGVVIEARLDKGKGPVASILIQQGTLKVGDNFIVGQYYGRVRALLNEHNQPIKKAEPAFPVQILGMEGVPEAGDKFIVIPEERIAREIAQRRQQLKREQNFRQIRLLTLDEISRQIKEGEVRELNIIVKADVDGSAQALSDSLMKLSNQEVAVKVIRRAVGPISESDVLLAAASKAIIIGFHVRATLKAKEVASLENVDIRLYKIIYKAIEEVKLALEGLLEPEVREQVIGLAEVREVFKISRLGNIAGCYVLEGKINRNSRVRLIRNDVEIYEGKLSSLKRFKEDTREVVAGYECGLMIENFNDIKTGDHIEAFEVIKEKRTLNI
jgi:translation initiation factor IF-2